jgi:O-antigen ligase
MNVLERLLLAIAVLEIPLQIDAYWYYEEQFANSGAVSGINISVTTFCLLGLYALWLFDAATLRQRRPGRLAFSAPLAAYVSIVALSMLLANEKMLALSYFALVAQAFLLLLYVANRVRSRSDVVFLASMLAASLALQGTIVVGSWFVAPRLVGSPLSLGPVQVSTWAGNRLCGTLSTPVSAGSYLALLLLPVASLLLAPVAGRVKALALVAVTTGTLALCLTQSRGSVAAVFLASVVYGVLLFRRGWLPKLAVATAVVLAATSAFPLVQMLQNRSVERDMGSAVSRIHLAQIAWNLIQDQPLLGVGTGNYHVAAQPYANAPPFRSEWFYTVHCTYLLEWAEVGLFGLAAFVAFLLSIVYCGWRVWQLRDPLLSVLALAIAVTVMGQMVHMFVDLFNSRAYIQTLWCCAAMVLAMQRIAEAEATSAMRGTAELPAFGGIGLSLWPTADSR